jgi:hypothetical protein
MLRQQGWTLSWDTATQAGPWNAAVSGEIIPVTEPVSFARKPDPNDPLIADPNVQPPTVTVIAPNGQ